MPARPVAEGNGRPSRIGRLVWVGWLAVLTVLGVGGYAGATRPVRQPARIISISVYDAGTPPPRAYLTPGLAYARIEPHKRPYPPPVLDLTVDALLVGVALGAIGLVWLVSTAQHRRAAQDSG